MPRVNPTIRRNFTCFICKCVIPGPYSSLVLHLKHLHGFKTSKIVNTSLVCGQNNCNAQFFSFKTYRYHLMNCEMVKQNDVPPTHIAMTTMLVCDDTANFDDRVSSICYPIEKDLIQLKTLQLGKMFLTLRTKHNVTNTALNFVSSEMLQILDSSSHLLNSSFSLMDAFLSLNSLKNRTDFYVKNLGYKSPRQMLSLQRKSWANRFHSSCLNQRIVNHYFHYIPIKETLSTLFSNPKFRTLYFSEQPSSDGRIRTHVDTEHFRSHRLFNEFPGAVRIQMFNDDLEVVNPCGSKTKKHQLAMFCFTILNLPPCLLSQLPHIHPFAICKTSDVVEDNFAFVIREFMVELHELESDNGMLLDVAD